MIIDRQCNICGKVFPEIYCLRRHLTRVHGFEYPAQPELIVNPDLVPDVNDPNYYCISCDKHYANNGSFRNHIRRIHDIKLPFRVFANPELQPDIKTKDNKYCAPCNKSYATRENYLMHVRRLHNLDKDGKKLAANQCHLCGESFPNKAGHRFHLKHTHNVLPPLKTRPRPPAVIPNPHLKPDIDDPNFHCRACLKTFAGKYAYRKHIKVIHQVALEPILKKPSKIKHPELTPDINDVNSYCCACEKSFSTRYGYIYHLRFIHNMDVDNGLNMDATPDPDDANFYCCACNKHYDSQHFFRVHLRGVHRMSLVPLIEKRKMLEGNEEKKKTKKQSVENNEGGGQEKNSSDIVEGEKKKKKRKMKAIPSLIKKLVEKSTSASGAAGSSSNPQAVVPTITQENGGGSGLSLKFCVPPSPPPQEEAIEQEMDGEDVVMQEVEHESTTTKVKIETVLPDSLPEEVEDDKSLILSQIAAASTPKMKEYKQTRLFFTSSR